MFSFSLCDKILILQERADAEMEEIDSPEHALAIAEEAMDTSINDSQENQVQYRLKWENLLCNEMQKEI